MDKTALHDATRELGYVAKRSGLYMAGKEVAAEVAHPLGEVLGNVSGALGAVGTSITGLVTIGLTAAVSAALVQMDYHHKRNNIKELYKEELASKLRKPPSQVTAGDLDALAQENRTMHEELQQVRKQRNFGIVFSFLASMASLAVVQLALPAAIGALGLPALAGFGGLVASALVGLVAYNVVKQPLHWIGAKFFGLDATTTHDRIVSLKIARGKGREITREQVLSVFASANPHLDRFIAVEYGAAFDRLDPETRHKAAQDISLVLPLDKLVQDINSGKVNVTELAFAVDNQMSGIEKFGRPVEEKKPGLLGRLWHAVGFGPHSRQPAVMPLPVHDVAQAAPAHPGEKPGRMSFVQRLGRDKISGYVGRIEQVRNEPTVNELGG